MVALPAIVGGAHGYAFIFTHGLYQMLGGWLDAYNVQ